MVKVPEYREHITDTVVAGPRAEAPAAGAFGGQIAQGLANFGQGLSQMSERISRTSAEDALNNFEKAKNDLFYNPENGYFNAQGKDAYDRAKDTDKALNDLVKQYGDNLTPDARAMFEDVAKKHVLQGQQSILTHASKGLDSWQVATSKAAVENTVENASLNWNDPEKLRVQMALGESHVIDSSNRQGVGPEATAENLQTYRSSFASSAITAATNASSESGKAALEQYGKYLEGPDKLKMDQLIAAKQKSEKTTLEGMAASAVANKIVSAVDGDRAAALEMLKQVDDPELQSKARKEAMYQITQLETAKVEERTNIMDEAQKFGGSIEQYKTQNPEKWDKLTAKQQRELESGKPPMQNWNVWNDIQSMSDQDLHSLSPKRVEELASNLDGQHRDKLYTMWKKGEVDPLGRTRAQQTTAALEQIIGKKKGKWKEKELRRADTYQSMFADEIRNRKDIMGRELTPEEFTDAMNGFTRKVAVEGFLGLYDTEKDIGDVPEEHLPALTQYLRSNNIPITADNLIRAYEQAK